MKNIISKVPTKLYIGGKWKAASDGVQFTVYNPATEEALVEVSSATVADCLSAVDAAHDAAKGWAATPPRARGEILRKAYELMVERKDFFAKLISLEEGKTYAEGLGEMAYASEFYRWYAEEAPRIMGQFSRSPAGANNIMVSHKPVGVCVLITPWNFPAAMATRKIGPALAAGCTVILKPASETPLTALALAELMEEAGVPPGVVNVVPSRSSGKVVSAMLDDDRVRKISFTGSTEVGRILLSQAAQKIVNSSMELGGNAPLIVLEDADVDLAVEGALVAKMRNAGESCIGANRLYVHSSIYDEFTRKFAEKMAEFTVGPGLEDDVDIGPLVNADTRDKVKELVDGAVKEGAKILTGGKPLQRPGFFFEPTVLVDVAPDSAILHEEIFGPVAPIVSFETDEQVIGFANNTPFGLAAYVFGSNVGRALGVAEKIEAGVVGINRGFVSDPAAPFGGMKQSGIGREGAHEGLMEFVETQYIAIEW